MSTDEAGLHTDCGAANAALSDIRIAVVDRPREQRHQVLSLDLSGGAGHIAIVGGPHSGKSSLLRTTLSSIALSSTPRESQFYLVDLGGSLAPLRSLPHVSGVATRNDAEVLQRTVAEVETIMNQREAFFAAHSVAAMPSYRLQRSEQIDDGHGDVFVAVDGWNLLRDEYEEVAEALHRIATRGLGLGVHLLVTSNRWNDLRPAMRDLFGSRLELRLGDPLDSEVDRRLAQSVPTARPGRGLTSEGLHFMAALPCLEQPADGDDVAHATRQLAHEINAAWRHAPAPALRLLPHCIESQAVRSAARRSRHLLLGVAEQDLAPVGIDPTTEPHLLALGDAGSGKSSLLRAVAAEVARLHTPTSAQIIVVDQRRSLLGEIPDGFALDHLSIAAQAHEAISDLAAHLSSRLPGPEVEIAQLRTHSWWDGADAWVLVDDYDLIAAGSVNPLLPLVPLLPHARDVGLHLVATRRSAGASRALYDPVLQALRDLAMPALLLSSSTDEPPLFGSLRPRTLPAGRAQLLTRERGRELVQLAWSPPRHD